MRVHAFGSPLNIQGMARSWSRRRANWRGRVSIHHSDTAPRPARGRRWLHIGGATAAVALACLANPYGLRGALFPLELYPKISAWGGLYKSHIEEFRDLRTAIARWGVGEDPNIITASLRAVLSAVNRMRR